MAGRTATWYLIQHQADMRRREPRNVGVVLETPHGFEAKFFAEDSAGVINGRRLRGRGLDRDVHEAWVDYYRRKLSEDKWGDVLISQDRRVRNYRAVIGGHLFEDRSDWKAELDRLYAELVVDTSPAAQERDLLDRVGEILRMAELEVVSKYQTMAKFGDRYEDALTWDFAYQNGSLHLISGLKLGGWTAVQAAQAYNARARATADALGALSFLALYEGLGDGDDVDSVLKPLEAVGAAININDDSVVDQVREAAGSV